MDGEAVVVVVVVGRQWMGTKTSYPLRKCIVLVYVMHVGMDPSLSAQDPVDLSG